MHLCCWIPSDELNLIECCHATLKSMLGLGLTLKEETFKIKAIDPGKRQLDGSYQRVFKWG